MAVMSGPMSRVARALENPQGERANRARDARPERGEGWPEATPYVTGWGKPESVFEKGISLTIAG